MNIHLQFIFMKALFTLVESTMKPFIVDGDNAKITTHPHSLHVSISAVHCEPNKCKSKGNWVCGASIVTQQVGLTAAHCLNDCSKYSKIMIFAGDITPKTGVSTSVDNFIVHPDYVNGAEKQRGSDIALVRFKKPFKLSANIKRVALMENLPLPKEAYVAGWGYIQENPNIKADRLKELKQFLLTKEKCEELLVRLPNGTICGRNDKGHAAKGDSGSALIVEGYIQIGLVVFRMPYMRNVVVYTDVRYYYKWIQAQLYNLLCFQNFFWYLPMVT